MARKIIPIGPYHPLQEEPEFFKLHVDGETVVDIDIELGYNHRLVEKIAESKNFDQVAFMVERICGICKWEKIRKSKVDKIMNPASNGGNKLRDGRANH